MDIAHLIEVYVALTLGALCGIGIYSDVRRHRFWPSHNADRIFRCKNCNYVYTDDPDMDRSRCPQCGKLNEPIVF
jgi:hypothetical protein